MQKFGSKLFRLIFARTQLRRWVGTKPEKNIKLGRHVDKAKNLVYGGDLPVSTPKQSIGSLLFERLMKPERQDEILQICTSTKYGITTKKFIKHAVAVAERLRDEGIEKGDIICLVGNNSLNMNSALAGIFFLGAVPFPITHKTAIEEFRIVLKKIRPKYFACDTEKLPTLHQVLRVIGNYDTSKIFLLSNPQSNEYNLETFKEFTQNKGQNINSFKPASTNNPDTDLALMLKGARYETYGKVIGITHQNLNSVIARFEFHQSMATSKSVILMAQKVMWMSGVYCFLMSCCFGSQLIVMSDFTEEDFLQAIEDYKVNLCYIYTSKLWMLYKHNYMKEYDLSSCHYIQAFDGALPPGLIQGMKEKFGLVLKASFGINELTGLGLQPTDHLDPNAEFPVGELVPQMYGKIISDKTLHNGVAFEKGEICFKGPMVTKGYINDPESTRRIFDKDGFLLTGLYGYYDNEGYFFIIDKILYVINYKEYQISPRQLEGVIKSLEPVKDALVAGIKHPTDGYYPIAFVTLQKNMTITADEIMSYVNGKVEDHEKLRGGVVFINKIPRSRDTGALRRSLFRKVLSKYQIAKEVTFTEVPAEVLNPNASN